MRTNDITTSGVVIFPLFDVDYVCFVHAFQLVVFVSSGNPYPIFLRAIERLPLGHLAPLAMAETITWLS